jgi:hypothetical protein
LALGSSVRPKGMRPIPGSWTVMMDRYNVLKLRLDRNVLINKLGMDLTKTSNRDFRDSRDEEVCRLDSCV